MEYDDLGPILDDKELASESSKFGALFGFCAGIAFPYLSYWMETLFPPAYVNHIYYPETEPVSFFNALLLGLLLGTIGFLAPLSILLPKIWRTIGVMAAGVLGVAAYWSSDTIFRHWTYQKGLHYVGIFGLCFTFQCLFEFCKGKISLIRHKHKSVEDVNA